MSLSRQVTPEREIRAEKWFGDRLASLNMLSQSSLRHLEDAFGSSERTQLHRPYDIPLGVVERGALRAGFLGFGEAGHVISQALVANGLQHAVAYDCNYRHPVLGQTIQRRAGD